MNSDWITEKWACGLQATSHLKCK